MIDAQFRFIVLWDRFPLIVSVIPKHGYSETFCIWLLLQYTKDTCCSKVIRFVNIVAGIRTKLNDLIERPRHVFFYFFYNLYDVLSFIKIKINRFIWFTINWFYR
jgi:hypothetical protein